MGGWAGTLVTIVALSAACGRARDRATPGDAEAPEYAAPLDYPRGPAAGTLAGRSFTAKKGILRPPHAGVLELLGGRAAQAPVRARRDEGKSLVVGAFEAAICDEPH